jgi:3-dehydroquinate synthase
VGEGRGRACRRARGRIALNLGHTLGHAVEAAAGFRDLLHGEAVGYGLRAATRIGVARGVTPAERAERIERLLDTLELGVAPLSLDLDEVLDLMAIDKKRAHRAVGWGLPTASGHVTDAEIPMDVVREVTAGVLAGRLVGAR